MRASFSYKPGVFRVQAKSCAIKGYRPTEEVEKDGQSDNEKPLGHSASRSSNISK
ncbi:hypothetical protein NQZ68_002908, partial [Dissostichus eleginoides]